MFTFQCTRCRKKPAIVTRGRKVFLCADCATGSLLYDMVGSLMNPDGVPGSPPDEGSPDPPEPEDQADGALLQQGEAPTDPWAAHP